MRVNSVIMAVIIGFIKLTAISAIFRSAKKLRSGVYFKKCSLSATIKMTFIVLCNDDCRGHVK